MHNIYITLSCLHSIDGQIILWDITIQVISKTEFKFKGSIDMVTSTSIDITEEKHKHYMFETWQQKNLIMIEENLDDDIINDNVINYWHKDLQLLVNDEMS